VGNNNQFTNTIYPPRRYDWEPQEDITAYELALCLNVFLIAFSSMIAAEDELNALPADARRHFVEVKEEERER
jgi:hypothetical protein